MAGYTESFDTGNNDYWVLKLDASGSVQWQKTFGGSGEDVAESIRQTKDGGYIVVGYTWSFGAGADDFWVLKLDAGGIVQWQRAYGGSLNDWAHSIRQTRDGGYIVIGDTSSFGDGKNDIWVLRLKPDGTIDSSCDFVGDTAVSGMNSTAIVKDADANEAVTDGTEQTSSATVQDTDALANIMCKGGEEVCQCPDNCTSKGCISGQVTDDTGQPLEGKVIQISRIDKKGPGIKLIRVISDENGCYSASNLEDGNYRVRVRKCKGGGKKIVAIDGGTKVEGKDFQCK